MNQYNDKNQINDSGYDEERLFKDMDVLSMVLSEGESMDDFGEFLGNMSIEPNEKIVDTEIIREKTLKKVRRQCQSKNSYTNRKMLSRWSIAASIGIILTLGILFSDNAVAGIKKMLDFIPGINKVVENNEGINRLVLKDPVKANSNDRDIEINSIVFEEETKNIFVSLRGKGSIIKNLAIRLPNKTKVSFEQYSISSGGSEWQGGFSKKLDENTNLKENDEIEIIIDNEIITLVKLTKAQAYSSYEDLGPTSIENDLSITVIPQIKGDKLGIILMSPPTPGQLIDEYGLRPDYDREYQYAGKLANKISLKDEYGNEMAGNGLDSYVPPLNQFFFEYNESEKYLLTIPYVMMAYDLNEKFNIKLPKTGETFYYDDYTLDLMDYTLDILSISRPEKDQVIFQLDPHYNEDERESLYYLELDVEYPFFGEPVYSSWGADLKTEDGKIGPIQKLYIHLNKTNIKTLPLSIKKVITVKQGPWEMEINIDSMDRE